MGAPAEDALWGGLGRTMRGADSLRGDAAACRENSSLLVLRRRLVVALLETCGQYFKTGRAGRRLDRFLTFFQVCVRARGGVHHA